MFTRILKDQLVAKLEDSSQHKIILLFGSRQVGKTTLLHQVMEASNKNTIWINADRSMYEQYLSVRNLDKITELVGDNELLIIDEAQNISDIGINLKLIYDELPHLKVIATGSSSLELANKTKESLAGRAISRQLYPISIIELMQHKSRVEIKQELASYLNYGMYPELLTLEGSAQKRELLRELVDSYLYKDVLMLSNIRNSDKIYKLLQLLAFQIGSLVSVHELAKNLKLNHETVENYLDLLEKGFIIKRISGFSRNPRKEISKMDKIYFYDLGIRNMLINNFNDPEIRPDIGGMWENFMMLERLKFLEYNNIIVNTYFWKRYSGAEIDIVEEKDGKLDAIELKWKKTRKNAPESWTKDYGGGKYQCINRNNFFDILT